MLEFKIYMRHCIFIVAIFWGIGIFGQEKIKISGKITDISTNEPLIGATIYLLNSNYGTISNEHGYFSLYLTSGIKQIGANYLGYHSDTIDIVIYDNIRIDIKLERMHFITKEVVVSTKAPEKNVKSVESGSVQLTMREITKLPALMGESDFLRIIQLTPGVSAANEGNSGFFVRGGGADQNLILLDNANVYNPSHVLGFFSVFNSKTIANTKLIKSGIPANYGGRLSSVLNFTSRDGDLKRYSIQGTLGLLSSNLLVEGPIVKEKLSFVFAGRRSYIDEVIKPIIRPLVPGSSTFYDNSKYHFYDLNAKLSLKPTTKDKITLTAYQGSDKYSIQELQIDFKNLMNWGNAVIALNWAHRFNTRWNLTNSVSLTDYHFNLEAQQNTVNVDLFSGVRDLNYKLTLANIQDNGSIIKAGLEYTYHRFRPNNLSAETYETDLQFGSNRVMNAHEASAYYNHEFDIFYNTRVSAGLRYSHYIHVGPYYQMNRNVINEITDTTYFGPQDAIKTYNDLEPRISLRYQLNKLSSIKASYSLNNQYVHLASSSAVTLPTDVWLPSTNLIKPQRSTQYTLGYFRNFLENQYTGSLNIYYKDFRNQIELLQGFMNNFHDNIFEESITFGTGESYGVELHLQKALGNFTGWIGYTLSRTTRQFDNLNEGNVYPAKYDRTHDLNIVASYDLNQKWNLAATFIYATGNAMTLPESKYVIGGNVITQNGAINSFRMPDYHRLDLSVNYNLTTTEKFESILNFSVFNVYNRANPFYIYFQIEGNVYDGNIEITPKQISLFPILPSISWIFKF